MEISSFSFVLLAAYSFFFGIILGIAYDALRAVRLLLGARPSGMLGNLRLPLINVSPYPERKNERDSIPVMLATLISDILFILGCGTMVVMIAFIYNSGRIRVAIFAGVALGVILYLLTVGKITIKILETIAFALRSALLYVVFSMIALYKRIAKNKKERSKKRERKKKQKNESC